MHLSKCGCFRSFAFLYASSGEHAVVMPFQDTTNNENFVSVCHYSYGSISSHVPEEGLEPSHLAIRDFESRASAIPPLRLQLQVTGI